MHKHRYEIDPSDRGFNGPGSPIIWFRCKDIELDCRDPYELVPRGLMYHSLLGMDEDMWLEYVEEGGNESIFSWKEKGWLAFPQGVGS